MQLSRGTASVHMSLRTRVVHTRGRRICVYTTRTRYLPVQVTVRLIILLRRRRSSGHLLKPSECTLSLSHLLGIGVPLLLVHLLMKTR